MTDQLREWIEKELTIQDPSEILEEVKEKTKKLIRITKDGNFTVILHDTTDKDTCYLCFVARAYAFKAGYVPSDEMKNEDLKSLVKINPPSVDTHIMELRNEGIIDQVQMGVHKVNYLRLSATLDTLLAKIGEDNAP